MKARPALRRVGPQGEPVARPSHPTGCCGRCRASSGPQTHDRIQPLVRREWPSWPSPWRAQAHQTKAHQGPEGDLKLGGPPSSRLNFVPVECGRSAQPFALRPLGLCIEAVDRFRWPSGGGNRSWGLLPHLPRLPGGPPPARRAASTTHRQRRLRPQAGLSCVRWRCPLLGGPPRRRCASSSPCPDGPDEDGRAGSCNRWSVHLSWRCELQWALRWFARRKHLFATRQRRLPFACCCTCHRFFAAPWLLGRSPRPPAGRPACLPPMRPQRVHGLSP